MSPHGYVYVLRNHAGHFYVGSCLDPDRRLGEHVSGHVKATAGKGPWRRVALLEFESPTLSRQAEYWMKRLRRRIYIEKIVSGRFKWPERFGSLVCMDPAAGPMPSLEDGDVPPDLFEV